MPRTVKPMKPRHPAEAPTFLADYDLSPHLRGNLKQLATQYVAHFQQIQRNDKAMKRRGEVVLDVSTPWSNARIDSYVRRKMMLATEDALSAVLGMGEGVRFRREVLKAYGLMDEENKIESAAGTPVLD